jgi:protein-tyrosine phosphatase
MGNICRSPAAEGIFRSLISRYGLSEQLRVESCGMGDWHAGQLPDERMRDASKLRGIILNSRAQQFKFEFFSTFDYILASDKEILNSLLHHAPLPEQKAKVHLMTAFSFSYKGQDIPDPYYGGEAGFENVLDMLEDSCEGLLEQIRRTHP